MSAITVTKEVLSAQELLCSLLFVHQIHSWSYQPARKRALLTARCVAASNLWSVVLAKSGYSVHGPHRLALCAWKMSAMECISRENWRRMVSILPSSCLCISPPRSAASFEKLPSSWQAALALFSFLRSRRMPRSAPIKRAGIQRCALNNVSNLIQVTASSAIAKTCISTQSHRSFQDHA